jgi:hypothetical protein
MRAIHVAAAALFLTTPAFAQQLSPAHFSPQPIVAVQHSMGAADAVVPANTELALIMNQELSSKSARVGDKFMLSLATDVRLGDYIVIPRGTPAFGEVVWRTGKGAFGKSAKMEVEMRYLDLNGRRVPLSGKYRQEGEGNTGATVGAVVAVGVFGGFVTGKSAVIKQGRELKAYTMESLPVALPRHASFHPSAAQPMLTSNYAR